MDPLSKPMEEIVRAKEAWRTERAKLPYPEKVRIVVRLQERRAPIIRARGGTPRVWRLEETGR